MIGPRFAFPAPSGRFSRKSPAARGVISGKRIARQAVDMIESQSKNGDPEEETPIGSAFAIDREHLRRQCLGDRELEIELLALFERRSADLLAQLLATEGVPERRDIAHALKGMALAVGAHRVAAAANRCEGAAAGSISSAMRLALCEAVAEARSDAARIRGEG
jgi:HPt (histidine-containing phosphotransfer) domain-containing protein